MQSNRPESVKNNKLLIIIATCVAAAILLTSYVLALGKFADPESDVSEESLPTESSEEASEIVSEVSEESELDQSSEHPYYSSLKLESLVFSNEDIVNGPLAVLKDASNGYPKVNEEEFVKASVVKTGTYGLSNNSLVLYKDAMTNIDKLIVNFYNNVPSNGLIIHKAYESPEGIVSNDEQLELYGGYSVKFSIYRSSYKFTDTEFSFLPEQAYRYGVIQRYPVGAEEYTEHKADYTLYRYVGVAHSSYMNHYNYSLEEYIDKIKTEKIIEYACELDDNAVYVTYYVPLSGNEAVTYIPVPSDQTIPYTVSGDGNSGFIVTVKIPQE